MPQSALKTPPLPIPVDSDFPPARDLLPLAVSIFLGAFLLFQVQPLIGKFILPWFGGTPAVWTTCLLFFQAVLLLGYAYAHALTRYFTPRKQAIIHCAVLLGALIPIKAILYADTRASAWIPIVPDDHWRPTPGGSPVGQILVLLTLCVGLPYFALSATGPLLQAWFHRTNPQRSPYRLYALSNLGSLLALLSYPFVIEPLLSRGIQAVMWSVTLLVFAGLCAYCANRAAAVPDRSDFDLNRQPPKPLNAFHVIMWLALPACATAVLLATNNKVCQDVAVVPFLWVLPLALYLVTFIIAFDHSRWYTRWAFIPALVASVFAAAALLLPVAVDYNIFVQIGSYMAVLFFCCMVCHGEVVRLKPDPRHLTLFYLCIAAGGVIGGVFVAVIAPTIFKSFAEYPLSVLICCILISALVIVDQKSLVPRMGGEEDSSPSIFGIRVGILGALIIVFVAWGGGIVGMNFFVNRLLKKHVPDSERLVGQSRNFYGTLAVVEGNYQTDWMRYRGLKHGAIRHGSQFTHPRHSMEPTTYYGRDSGVGLAMRFTNPNARRRFAVVGLGVGTMATYAQPHDVIRFYEINPQVEQFAREYFTYLEDCQGTVEVVPGDARLSMEREDPQLYDVMAIDAFSGDAIPVHLLTKEAVEVYLKHLKKDGTIAIHVTNRHLDLRPVVINIAKALNLKYRVVYYSNWNPDLQDYDLYTFGCQWVLLSRVGDVIDSTVVSNAPDDQRPLKKSTLWTDDRTDLFHILRW